MIDSLNRLPADDRPIEGVTAVPFSFTGNGDQVTESFVLAEETLYVLNATFDDSDGWLVVVLLGMDGDSEAYEMIEESPGSITLSVDDTAEYLFEVSGDDWKLTVDRP